MDKGKEWLAVSGGKWRGAVKKGREFPGIGTLFLSQFLFVLDGKLHLSVIYGGLHCILLPFLILFSFLLLFFSPVLLGFVSMASPLRELLF